MAYGALAPPGGPRQVHPGAQARTAAAGAALVSVLCLCAVWDSVYYAGAGPPLQQAKAMSPEALEARDRLRAKQAEYQQAEASHASNLEELKAGVDVLVGDFKAAQQRASVAGRPGGSGGGGRPASGGASPASVPTGAAAALPPAAGPPPIQMSTTFASGMILQHGEPLVAGFCASARTEVAVVLSAQGVRDTVARIVPGLLPPPSLSELTSALPRRL